MVPKGSRAGSGSMMQLGAQLVVLNESKGQSWILGLYLYCDSCLAIPGAKDVVESLFCMRKEKKHLSSVIPFSKTSGRSSYRQQFHRLLCLWWRSVKWVRFVLVSEWGCYFQLLFWDAGSVRPSQYLFSRCIWLCHLKATAKPGCACRLGITRGSKAGKWDETTRCSHGGGSTWSCSTVHC